MKNTQEIVDGIGRERIAEIVGVRPTAVYQALRNGKLPSSWYVALCEEVGHPLPPSAFSFKGIDR